MEVFTTTLLVMVVVMRQLSCVGGANKRESERDVRCKLSLYGKRLKSAI